MKIDYSDTVNDASVELLLDDLAEMEPEQRSLLKRLAQSWASETDFDNGEMAVALARAYEGYELAKGRYIWPD